MSTNNYGEQPFPQDPTNIQEAIPHSGMLPEDMRETPVHDFSTSLEDDHSEGLIQTPDSLQGIAPEPSTVAPHDPTPTNERVTHEELRAALPLTAPVAPLTTPERPSHAKRNIAIAAAGAVAAAAIGGGAFLLGRHGNDNESATHPKTTPAATSTRLPVANSVSSSPAAETDSRTPISAETISAGNLNLNNLITGNDATGVEIGNQGIFVPSLMAPGTTYNGYTFTNDDLGEEVLANFAALMSLEEGSRDYNTIINSFTDSVNVKTYIARLNAQFQAHTVNPGAEFEVIFDSADDPVTFEDHGLDDDDNHQLYAHGTIYTLPAPDTAKWQDPSLYAPAKAWVFNDPFMFSYSVSPDGDVKIENLAAAIVQQ